MAGNGNNGYRWTCEQMIAALQRTKGMVYLAARDLGCSHQTVYNYAKRHPSVQDAIDSNRGGFIDVAELKLWEAVNKGQPWAVAFALKTIGKNRGFTERQEVSGPDGEAITVDFNAKERLAHLIDRFAAAETEGGDNSGTDGGADN